MTTTEAEAQGLSCHAFRTMQAAFAWACEHRVYSHTGTPHAVHCFREEVAHFDVYFVAVRPLPSIKKFHDRIVKEN